MNADAIGDALSWVGDAALIEALDEAFMADCESALRARIDLKTADAVERLDARALRRLLRAPEISRQILFVATAEQRDIDQFVRDAVRVELILCGIERKTPVACWSALGDVQLLKDGTARWWPKLTGPYAVPLDFGSPWAQRIDLSGRHELAAAGRPAFADAEVERIHRGISESMQLLWTLSPTLPQFVSLATCVLVLQIDPSSGAVASGTNGRYVGRSFIANPQSTDTTLDCLAEAMVHEAIHGMIFRESLRRPWVEGEASVEVPRVPSPWTGRPLPVRPYLEAVCVWFGLVHLWALALRRGEFEPGAAHRRLMRSMRGFCGGALVDAARPWWRDIRADVLETIDCLQRRVVDALGGAM